MTPPGRPRALDHRVEKRAVDARSTEHWLVHPRGARSRGNGSQPEATGRRFTLRTTVRAWLDVLFLRINSPLAHVRQAPGSTDRGFVVPCAGHGDGSAPVGSVVAVAATSPLLADVWVVFGHLSPVARAERSIRGKKLARVRISDGGLASATADTGRTDLRADSSLGCPSSRKPIPFRHSDLGSIRMGPRGHRGQDGSGP